MTAIWQVSADGSIVRPLLPGWHPAAGERSGKWTPDGKYFVFQSEDQLWAVREAGGFLRKVSRDPVQLTSGLTAYSYPLPGKDGKKLFAVAGLKRGDDLILECGLAGSRNIGVAILIATAHPHA